LSENQEEEKDWAFIEKNTGFVLQCDSGTEHTSTQGSIPKIRKSGIPKIKNHPDLLEVTNNHQHI